VKLLREAARHITEAFLRCVVPGASGDAAALATVKANLLALLEWLLAASAPPQMLFAAFHAELESVRVGVTSGCARAATLLRAAHTTAPHALVPHHQAISRSLTTPARPGARSVFELTAAAAAADAEAEYGAPFASAACGQARAPRRRARLRRIALDSYHHLALRGR
jgi:hypothetical protein